MAGMGNTLAEAWVRVGVDVGELRAGLEKARGHLDNFQGKLKSIQPAVNRMAMAAGGAIAAAAVRFGSFEQSMLNVSAVMRQDLSSQPMQELTAAAKEMGATTQFTSKQSADALISLSRAGFTANEQLKMLPHTLNLAAADGLDIASASDIVAKAMNGMGLAAKDTQNLVDVLAAASATANTDVTMLGAALEKIGPVGKSQGRSLEELVAAIQLLSDAGFQGAEGGNALRRILTRLNSPSKEAAELFDEIKFSAADADGNLKPLAVIVKELRDAFSTMTPEQKAVNANIIAGQTAIAQFSALLDAGGEKLSEYQNRLGHVDDTGQKMADTMMDGLNGQFQLMNSAIDAAVQSMGESLAPALTAVMEVVIQASNWLKEFIEQHPTLADWAGKVAIAIVAFAGALSGLITSLSIAKGALVAMNWALGMQEASLMSAVGATMKSTAAIRMLKLGLVAAAVTGLVYFAKMQAEANRETSGLNDALREQERLDGLIQKRRAAETARKDEQLAGLSPKERVRAIDEEIKAQQRLAQSRKAQAAGAQKEYDRQRAALFKRYGAEEGTLSSITKIFVDQNEELKVQQEEVKKLESEYAKVSERVQDLREQQKDAAEEFKKTQEQKKAAFRAEAIAAHEELKRRQQIAELETKIAAKRGQIAKNQEQIGKLEGGQQQTTATHGIQSFQEHIQSQLTPRYDKQIQELRKANDLQREQLQKLEEQTNEIRNISIDAKFQAGAPAGGD